MALERKGSNPKQLIPDDKVKQSMLGAISEIAPKVNPEAVGEAVAESSKQTVDALRQGSEMVHVYGIFSSALQVLYDVVPPLSLLASAMLVVWDTYNAWRDETARKLHLSKAGVGLVIVALIGLAILYPGLAVLALGAGAVAAVNKKALDVEMASKKFHDKVNEVIEDIQKRKDEGDRDADETPEQSAAIKMLKIERNERIVQFGLNSMALAGVGLGLLFTIIPFPPLQIIGLSLLGASIVLAVANKIYTMVQKNKAEAPVELPGEVDKGKRVENVEDVKEGIGSKHVEVEGLTSEAKTTVKLANGDVEVAKTVLDHHAPESKPAAPAVSAPVARAVPEKTIASQEPSPEADEHPTLHR